MPHMPSAASPHHDPNEKPTEERSTEIFTLRPSFYGISVDLKELWRRIPKKWRPWVNNNRSKSGGRLKNDVSYESPSAPKNETQTDKPASNPIDYKDALQIKPEEARMTNSITVRCLENGKPVRDLTIGLHKGGFWGGALDKGKTNNRGEVEMFYQKFRGEAVIYIGDYKRADLQIYDDTDGEELEFHKVDGEWWPKF